MTSSSQTKKRRSSKSKRKKISDYKREELIDLKKEKKVLKKFFKNAFARSDQTWSNHNTKDRKISVDYKTLSKNGMSVVRGRMRVAGITPDMCFAWNEMGYNDVYKFDESCDKMCTHNYAVACIDSDHDVCYQSFSSGIFGIADRDFVVLRGRYLLTDYKAPNGKQYKKVCATVGYSLTDAHPLYKPEVKKHVRGTLLYSGMIVIEEYAKNNPKQKACLVITLSCMDPGGWIPQWVVNMVAPESGMVIKDTADNWPKVARIMAKRKKNGYKKDNKLLFDSPAVVVEDATAPTADTNANTNEDNNNDDNDDDNNNGNVQSDNNNNNNNDENTEVKEDANENTNTNTEAEADTTTTTNTDTDTDTNTDTTSAGNVVDEHKDEESEDVVRDEAPDSAVAGNATTTESESTLNTANDDGNDNDDSTTAVAEAAKTDPNVVQYQKAVYNNDVTADETINT